jgi:hypothetical protein
METIPSAGANFSSVRHETYGNINASVSIPSFVSTMHKIKPGSSYAETVSYLNTKMRFDGEKTM